MASPRFILTNDVHGYRHNEGVISSLRKAIGGDPNLLVNVLRGELVVEESSYADFNLKLCRDPTILLKCCEEDVAPLCSLDEFRLLEGILKPGERFEAFNAGQLELGLKLEPGCKVYVKVSKPHHGVKRYVRAVVHYKGKVGNHPGTMFGVEILGDGKVGSSDGTFQESRYFVCKEGYGVFLPLHMLSMYQSDGDHDHGRKKVQSNHGVTSSMTSHKDAPSQNTRSKAVVVESSVDFPSAYQIGVMASPRFILTNDVHGYRHNEGVISSLRKAIGGDPNLLVNVLRGELVVEESSYADFNLKLCRDPTILLKCCEEDVAPLCSLDEFRLLEGILKPGERFEAFNAGQLEPGLKLEPGCKVYVNVSKPHHGVKKYVRAVVHYKGKVGNHPGTMFGVEILGAGKVCSSDGTFQERRYFVCKEGYGLFVPLHLLSMYQSDGDHDHGRKKVQSNHGVTSSMTSHKDAPSQNTRAKAVAVESSGHFPSAYQIGERVSFHDKKGNRFEGLVRWTGKSTPSSTRDFDCIVIGIQTDEMIFKTDFDRSIVGLDHLIKPSPKSHTLFLPETLVDKILIEAESDRSKLEEGLASNVAKDFDMSRDQLMSEQSKALEEAEATKRSLEKQVAMEALKVAGEDENNLSQQQEEYRKFQDGSKAGMMPSPLSDKKHLEPNNDVFDYTKGYEIVPTPPKGTHYASYEPPSSSYHANYGRQSSGLDANYGRQPSGLDANYGRQPSGLDANYGRALSTDNCFENKRPSGSGAVSSHQGGISQDFSVVASTGERPPLDIGVGHLVEVPCASLGKPMGCGVVKWIGQIPKVEGLLAGIELDEYMEGCTNGSWSDGNSQTYQFFKCPNGKGLYYPLNSIRPDSRYAPSQALDGNHITTKSISTEDDDLFQSVEVEDENSQESKQRELHQRIDYSQEEIFSTLKKKFTEELKSISEDRDGQIKEMALVIQSKEKEIRRLKDIILSKDIAVQKKEDIIASRDIVMEKMLNTLQDKEILIMEITEELQSNKLELQQMASTIKDLQQRLSDIKNEESLLQLTGLRDSFAPWKIDRSEINTIPKKQIGSGAWGVVYSGHFKGESVAIKIAHREILLGVEGTVDMIKREICIMAHIQHPNLVRFIGAVVDKRVDRKMDTPIIVLELLDMDLREAYARKSLERSTMLSIFCDVAYALHYLHDQREAIIHRDISAPNILLKILPNGLFKAKVSDLGSANLVTQSKTAGAGAIIYTAPEMFPQDISSAQPPQTTKVDVFSFGILLLEVVSKAIPTTDIRHSLLQSLKAKWERIYDLIVHCTKQSPSDRPTMRIILNILNRMQHVHN